MSRNNPKKDAGGWPGLVPSVRRFLWGKANPPKFKRVGETTTPTSSTSYDAMQEDYSWFRRDELVRRCVVVNSLFATMVSGFETVLEATDEDADPEDYAFVKEGIDQINRDVNLGVGGRFSRHEDALKSVRRKLRRRKREYERSLEARWWRK